MLEVRLPQNRHEFAPGEVISGEVAWNAPDGAPGTIELVLLYRTEGRGTQDIKYAAELSLKADAPSGTVDFRLALPEGPYTFDGTLISLRWLIEVSAGDEVHEEAITVSPWVETVKLQAYKEPDSVDILQQMQGQQQQ